MGEVKKDVKQIAIQSLEELGSWVKDSKHFVLSQAPDVARQIVYREVFTNLALACFSLPAAFWVGRLVWEDANTVTKHYDEFMRSGWNLGNGIAAGLVLFMACFGVASLLGGLSAIVAPKLTVLEYVRGLADRGDE